MFFTEVVKSKKNIETGQGSKNTKENLDSVEEPYSNEPWHHERLEDSNFNDSNSQQ